MRSRTECSTSWNNLIFSIYQDSEILKILIPYGAEICDVLKNQQLESKKFSYEDIKKVFNKLKDKVNAQRREIENEKKQVSELSEKNEKKEQKIEKLESQNYKQLIGLSVGLPAIGISGAGAVIGLPLLVKLLKGVFTRS